MQQELIGVSDENYLTSPSTKAERRKQKYIQQQMNRKCNGIKADDYKQGTVYTPVYKEMHEKYLKSFPIENNIQFTFYDWMGYDEKTGKSKLSIALKSCQWSKKIGPANFKKSVKFQYFFGNFHIYI